MNAIGPTMLPFAHYFSWPLRIMFTESRYVHRRQCEAASSGAATWLRLDNAVKQRASLLVRRA